ncbi:MAG: hypothetical protein KAT00_06110, partial [Planctomycetes bacterium]|nr:hypothetical protein [Planctomycetota bacterium]
MVTLIAMPSPAALSLFCRYVYTGTPNSIFRLVDLPVSDRKQTFLQQRQANASIPGVHNMYNRQIHYKDLRPE